METIELIKKAKSGDKEALLSLIMTQQADFYKLAYVYMKNEQDAMDALQDMIVVLYDNISKLKKNESFYSWSKTILVNSCKAKLKKNNKVISFEEIKEPDGDYSENPEDKIVLDKYLSTLSMKHQEVIKLRYYMDLDYEIISQVLKIPLGTVKSRLNAGMKKLKEALGGEYYE
ncbi:sigma-70 family RNA polymerase sigma factor [Tissierella sp. Yu-01]|uniref:RNA polymerase sigma factor n=1 Tax=Tissierella sp. Yu-01 TaxID=3035694 RepID=UPI00240E50D3|nr:sigma-70 family RNA polymerase sigma factor [Tissierella sp. Yu-01]WFA08443.1 sigma-70 family RNA polymerase sigma factor [Tissierella sp. Yu-01]